MTVSLSRAPNKLSVVVPRRFSLVLCLFYPLWVAAWVILVISNPPGKPESVIAVLGFVLVSIGFAYLWLWNLSGREELEFTPLTLTSRRVLFRLSRIREFKMDKIGDPHFVESRSRGMYGRTPSGLGFSYNGKTIRLCDHLTQAEAKALVSAVIQQFPQHAECWKRYAEGLPEFDEYMTLDLK